MKKFFIILVFLFLIALFISILTGNIAWKDIKHKSVTVKESFLKTSRNISETAGRINDSIQEKIKETREYWNKKRSP